MTELIEMPFGGLSHVSPKNHVLYGVQIATGRITFEGGHVPESWRSRPKRSRPRNVTLLIFRRCQSVSWRV